MYENSIQKVSFAEETASSTIVYIHAPIAKQYKKG